MTSTSITYTLADRDRLVGSGQVEDQLLYNLIEMAAYDMQRAEVEVDTEDQSVEIRQTPHQGDERTTTAYLPIGQIVEEWLTSEETRTSDANIYDYTADEVAEIRDSIRLSESE